MEMLVVTAMARITIIIIQIILMHMLVAIRLFQLVLDQALTLVEN